MKVSLQCKILSGETIIYTYILTHTQAPACTSIIKAIIMKVFLQHKNLVWRDYSKHAHTHTHTHNHPNT